MRLEAVTATNFRAAPAETWLAEAAHQRASPRSLPEALAHELDEPALWSSAAFGSWPPRRPSASTLAWTRAGCRTG